MDSARAIRTLAAGALAALFALALDHGLAFLTVGYWIQTPLHMMGTQLAAGVVAALLAEVVAALRGRPLRSLAHSSALALALLYAGPVIERFYRAAEIRGLSPALCAGAAAVGVGGYLLALVLLRRVAGPRSSWGAPALAALAVAVGLALNRHVFLSSFAPASLAGNAALALATFGFAALARAGRAVQLGAVAAAVAVAGLLFVQAAARRSTPLGRGAGDSQRPDLVLVLIDTLRYDVFRAVVAETEEGRRFAEVVDPAAWFTQMVAAAPWTAPSVGSIMTGLYPQEHGFERPDPKPSRAGSTLNRLADSATTLAERLSERGYVTNGIITNQAVAGATGMARGFQRYELLGPPTARLPLLSALAWAGFLPPEPYASAAAVRHRLATRLAAFSASDAPLFLYLHFLDPHEPLLPHPDLTRDPAGARLPELDRLYRDETRFALREITRILELLRALPRWERTLLVVVSDHGDMLPSDGHEAPVRDARGRPGTYGHGFALYESLIHVPLVIRPPGGLPEHREIDVLASHVDLHDTIAELMGGELPPIGRDRVSLAPWLARDLRGPGPRGREQALAGSIRRGPRQRALRLNGLKLIHYPDGERADELYDLASDAGETRSLTSARPQLARATQARLDRFWSRLDAISESPPVRLTPDMQEQLQALGYVDSVDEVD